MSKNLKITGPVLLDTSKNENYAYVEELENILEGDATNIGLCGSVSSGKSSIVKTFTRDREDIIVVPLSNYVDNANVDDIEKDIIRFIAYTDYKEDVHGSKIKRLSKNESKRFLRFSIVYLLSSVAGILLGNLFATTFKNMFHIYINQKVLYVLIAMYLMVFGICLINVIFNCINKVIGDKKDNTNYDLVADDNDTPIKKYMIELIKIFKYTEKKIVIFEDLDMFDKNIVLKVLEDLRSANNIINAAAGMEYEEEVKFIYCVDDSVFKTEKIRSKFFDVTVSVVPVSTSFNSLMISSNLLEENDIELDSKLIEIVSNRISDIRVIKCIINDYILFDKILNVDNKNKLFSLAVVKNIYLNEYEDITKLIKERLKQPKEDDILSDLIISEYIDKNYIDYITKPLDKLNKDDNKYLFNINHELESYSIELTNMKSIIKYLNTYFNINKYVLNISLINYLMKNNNDLYKTILNQFFIVDEYRYNFLKTYKEYNKELYYKFINDLNDNGINIWNKYIESGLTDEEFFASSIYYLNLDINELDSIELLKETIDNNLTNEDIKYNKIVLENINKLKVRFTDISKYKSSKYMIDNLLFKINFNNLKKILNKKKITNIKPLFKDNFKDYLLDNINDFETIYFEEEILIGDNKCIEELINSEASNKLKKEIIAREEFIIDITNCSKELVKDMYDNNRIKNTWISLNILDTILDSNSMKEYIINNKKELFKSTKGIEELNLKLVKLICNTLIENNLYKECTKIVNNYKENIKLTINKNSSTEEIEYKVNNNMLELTEGNTVLINNLDNKYIEIYYKNITDYKKLYTIIKKKKLEVLLMLKVISDLNALCTILVSVNKDYDINEYINVLFKKKKKYKVEYTKDIEKLFKKIEYIEYTVEDKKIEFKII